MCPQFGFPSKITFDNDTALPEIQLKPIITDVHGHDPKIPSLYTHPRSPTHTSSCCLFTVTYLGR